MASSALDRGERMPTPLSLGHDLSFQQAPDSAVASAGESGGRLAIVCGWMGAKPNQMRPYVNFYLNRGFNVMSYAVG
jgi:hypothetical protein